MNVAEVKRDNMDNGVISPSSHTFQDFFSTLHGTNVNGKKWLNFLQCHCRLHHHQAFSSSVCTWKPSKCSCQLRFWGDSSLLMNIWPNNPSTMIEESAYELSSISVRTTQEGDVQSILRFFAHFFPVLRSLQNKWKVPWYFRKYA